MARKRFTAEQIIIKLREAEVGLAQGQPSEGVGSHPLKPLNRLLTLGPYLSHFR